MALDEDMAGDLIDEQLLHLHNGGPAPDLSGLDRESRAEILALFEIVNALAGSLPASPPLEQDPVAIRLGLVSGDGAAGCVYCDGDE